MTFEQIRSKAANFDYFDKVGLGYRIHSLLDSAAQNADDAFMEKACTESEWDGVARSSLEMLLGCCKDKRVAAWFRRAGFVW